MSKVPAKIADAEAHQLWKRAIEIQSAAERVRSEPRSLPAVVGAGLSVEEVVEVGKSAGIDPSHLYLALAERALPDAELLDHDRRTARWARTLFPGGDAIEISHLFDAPPEKVVAAFHNVVSKQDFLLDLEDRIGPNPPYDGVLVYRVGQPSRCGSSFHGGMFAADARVVLVTASAEGARTRLRLRLPYYEHGLNLSLTGVLAGGLGTVAGFGGAAAGSAVGAALGTTALTLVAAPATLGVLAGGALGVAGFRRVVRWGRRRGETELRRLLKTVALEAEGGEALLPDKAAR